MKYKKLAAVLALILGFSLTACSGGSQTAGGGDATTAADEAAEEEQADDGFWEEETDTAQEAAETETPEDAGKTALEENTSATETAAASLDEMLQDAQGSTETEVALAAFSPGRYEGDTYTQPYFGIQMTKEDSMTWEDTESLLKTSGISASWDDTEVIEAALSETYLMDFQCYTSDGSSIMTEIFKVTMSEEKMLSDLSNAMQVSMEGDGAEDVTQEEQEIEVLGEKRKSIVYHAKLHNIDLYIRFCGYSKGPYTIVFYASSPYEDKTVEYLNKFKPAE